MLFFKDRKVDLSEFEIDPVVKWGDERFLVLYGDPGAGKTTVALSYLNQWEGWEFCSVVELFTEIRRYKSSETIQQILDDVARAPRMIIDDVGYEPEGKHNLFGTDYIFEDEVKSLLFLREAAGLRTIVSTNQSPDQLAQTYGPRIYSRLVRSGVFYVFDGDWSTGIKPTVTKDPTGRSITKSKISLIADSAREIIVLTPEEKKKEEAEVRRAIDKLPPELRDKIKGTISRWTEEPKEREPSTAKVTPSASGRSSRTGSGGSASRKRGASTK